MSTRFLVLSIYSIALFILAVIPPIGITIQRAGMMLKLHHIAGFAVHSILVWIYFAGRSSRPKHWALLVPVMSFLLGVLIEFTQLFLPYRSGRVGDLLQNALGIALGQGLIYLALARGWLSTWVKGTTPFGVKGRPD